MLFSAALFSFVCPRGSYCGPGSSAKGKKKLVLLVTQTLLLKHLMLKELVMTPLLLSMVLGISDLVVKILMILFMVLGIPDLFVTTLIIMLFALVATMLLKPLFFF